MAQRSGGDTSASAFNMVTDVGYALNAAQITTPTSTTAKRKLGEDQVDNDDTPTKKKKKQWKANTRVKRKECVTCCNRVAINRFPKLPHKSAEKHGRDVCFDCWQKHLKSEIQSKGFDSVCCPLCDEALEESEIKKLAKDDAYGE